MMPGLQGRLRAGLSVSAKYLLADFSLALIHEEITPEFLRYRNVCSQYFSEKKKITKRGLAMCILLKRIPCSPALQQLRVTGVGTQKHSYF